MNETQPTRLFSCKSAAEFLGVSVRRVNALCNAGRFGQRLDGNGPWIITRAELLAHQRDGDQRRRVNP